MSERLQKVLAAAGHGSRRGIEQWITDGRVRVNGEVATLGVRVEPTDEVRIDGIVVRLDAPETGAGEVLVYHKPVGEVTTRSDPEGRPTVFDRLPAPRSGRWVVIGRLDANTSGLLLFTTDGELAHRLMHPSTEIEREYLVRLRGRPAPEALKLIEKGVELDDGFAKFDRVIPGESSGGHSWYRCILHEGRFREVRRVWEAVGFDVSRLMRIRFANFELPRQMRPGAARLATPAELKELAKLVGTPG